MGQGVRVMGVIVIELMGVRSRRKLWWRLVVLDWDLLGLKHRF